MKKGFTLMEVLSVILIISFISIIVLPPIINQFTESENKIDEVTETLIIEAANLYISDNNIEKDSSYCIKIDELVYNNYLDKQLYYANGSKINTNMFAYLEADNFIIKSLEIKEDC